MKKNKPLGYFSRYNLPIRFFVIFMLIVGSISQGYTQKRSYKRDVIYLKDGTVLKGEIIKKKYGETVSFALRTGEALTIKWDDIEKFDTEQIARSYKGANIRKKTHIVKLSATHLFLGSAVFFYERQYKSSRSSFLGGLSYGKNPRILHLDYSDVLLQASVAYRYHLSKQRPSPTGVYIEPIVKGGYAMYGLSLRPDQIAALPDVLPEDGFNYSVGLNIGYQIIYRNSITFDFNGGYIFESQHNAYPDKTIVPIDLTVSFGFAF